MDSELTVLYNYIHHAHIKEIELVSNFRVECTRFVQRFKIPLNILSIYTIIEDLHV